MLTPRLVPYSPVRHLVLPLTVGAGALAGWMAGLAWVLWSRGGVSLTASPGAEGVRLLAAVAACTCAASLWAEGRIVRSPLRNPAST